MENREILFRGIRSDNHKWVEGVPIESNIDYEGYKTYMYVDYTVKKTMELINEKAIFGYCVEVIPETLGQFTGLPDKKETKIFEGDRVKCANPSDGLTDFGEVVMSGLGCWSIRVNGLIVPLFEYIEYPLSIVHDFKRIEIIGTIHDHILKGELWKT